MQIITVIYHSDEGRWWADSSGVPGWTAAADTLDELRPLIEDGVRFALDDASDVIVEHRLEPRAAVVFNFVTGQPATNPDVWSSVAPDAAIPTLAVA